MYVDIFKTQLVDCSKLFVWFYVINMGHWYLIISALSLNQKILVIVSVDMILQVTEKASRNYSCMEQ